MGGCDSNEGALDGADVGADETGVGKSNQIQSVEPVLLLLLYPFGHRTQNVAKLCRTNLQKQTNQILKIHN